MTIRIALYQPDIPQNTGTIIRMAACFSVGVDIIEPAGFSLSDRWLRRAGMDYLERATLTRHTSFEDFRAATAGEGRLVLLTTSGATDLHDFVFEPGDTLLFGRESEGAPPRVHEAADARIVIPMAAGMRSLNLAVSAAIATAEALRQIGGFPTRTDTDTIPP